MACYISVANINTYFPYTGEKNTLKKGFLRYPFGVETEKPVCLNDRRPWRSPWSCLCTYSLSAST